MTCSKQEQVHRPSSIICSPYQDVKVFIHLSVQTLHLLVCRGVWELESWDAIWRGRVHHPALENKQGNDREVAKEEEGAEGKVGEVASAGGASHHLVTGEESRGSCHLNT